MDGKPVPRELGGAYRAGPGLDLQQHVLLMYIFYSRIRLILACGFTCCTAPLSRFKISHN